MFSKEIAEQIVAAEDNFYKKEEEDWAVYNYRLYITKEQLKKYPLETLLELRGLAIYKDGTVIPSIHKFFNCGELGFTCDPQHDELRMSFEKIDGSLIVAFWHDGRLWVKSKSSFSTPQALAAAKLLQPYESVFQDYSEHVFLFEYVSPWNQVVIQYPKEAVNLLHVRKKNTLEYDWAVYHKLRGFIFPDYAKPEMHRLEYLLDMKYSVEGKEGWVLWFEGPPITSLRKLKTEWYLERHRLIADKLQPNKIVEVILDKRFDDLISQVDPGTWKYEWLLDLEQKVLEKYHSLAREALKILHLFGQEVSRKEFALQFNKHPLFPILMEAFGREDMEDVVYRAVEKYIRRNTNREQKALEFLGMEKF